MSLGQGGRRQKRPALALPRQWLVSLSSNPFFSHERRMRPDDQDDQSEQFIELYETNVLEQVAQSVVANVRTVIQHRARYEPVDASDFPERDAGFYNRTRNELSALGFNTLGDFEDASLVVTDPSKKTFVRFALGAHGAIGAMWFEVPAAEGEPLHCLVLQSWLDDGRTIVTTRGTIDSGLPLPPHIVGEEVDATVDTKATVRTHGEQVAATGKAPTRIADVADLFARHSRDELKIAEFREAQGAALFEPMLRTLLGASYDEQGEPILDAIQRHPEWLRGEMSSEPSGMRVRAVRGDEFDPERFPHLVIARLPEHIGPIDRGERYEAPLKDALAIRELGVVTGGGSQLTPTAEIGFVEVELALADLDGALDVVKRILEEAGAPVGSQLLFERNGTDVELPFGVQEAVTLYVDGVSLPDEVYEQLDLDEFMERLAQAVESAGGESRTTWSGATETAFYHYGPSADAILGALQPVFDAYPVCQNARIVIRGGANGATRTIRLPKRNGA